jgi:hypothetical protein
METTTMQFDSHEGCFSQPYSCRPVDAAPTDYPRNHGIIGYLLPTRQRTSYASSSVVETSSSGVSVSALVHSGSTRGHKNIMEGAIPPPACAGGLLARRDETHCCRMSHLILFDRHILLRRAKEPRRGCKRTGNTLQRSGVGADKAPVDALPPPHRRAPVTSMWFCKTLVTNGSPSSFIRSHR